MKLTYAIAAAGALVWLAGCASTPRATTIPAVGPAPTPAISGLNNGSLQVYSAWRQPRDPNIAERLWNDRFGARQILSEQPHSDYTVYSGSGVLVRRVRNTCEPDETQPALVSLPPGLYTIKAPMEAIEGGPITVTVPVEIQSGKCTAVHLEGNWMPSQHGLESELVQLPGGWVIGWRTHA